MRRTREGHTPLISVVIPVHGVRRYLSECLDSVLGQVRDGGIEVIAVDDASPDGCGTLLDERSSYDSRLTVLHLERTRGPGNARNVGLAEAAGSYVWFVDGDDTIPSGAVDAIRERLDSARPAADRPQVLLIDYREFVSPREITPNPGRELLRSAPRGVFTLADAPQVINLTMTAWSKLFDREFLIGLREPFRDGIHEDIPVTSAALFAGRLATLDRACYCYRRSRPGSFMATSSTDHFAVFDAYEDVFAMLHKLVAADAPVATDAVQTAVFERAIWHYAAVLQTTGAGLGRIGLPGLVPREQRRRFFERMHEDFLRYAPPHYQLPPGARGAKFALIKRDDYVAYELLEPVNRLRVGARKALRRMTSGGNLPGRASRLTESDAADLTGNSQY
jgi:CDP-glycerol glycerophosphotransferase